MHIDVHVETEEEMKTLIIENTWLRRDLCSCGWGNGYVLIPVNHPLHGKDYNDINVDVHGGLTFSELVTDEFIKFGDIEKEDIGKWCVGFDTAHSGDNLHNWSKNRVEEETEQLKQQLMAYSN